MDELTELATRTKTASAVLASSPSDQRMEALQLAADELDRYASTILEANAVDVADARAGNMLDSAIDRLQLNDQRLASMAHGLRSVASKPDPIGEIDSGWVMPNGLRVRKVRVPLGVVAIIYENRPNVTSDTVALCLRSGNSAFLRGSASALHSNTAVAQALRAGVTRAGLPADAVALVEDTSRETAVRFMQLQGFIDCLVPRGGKGLVDTVRTNATVPFVVDGDGNCHIYVDAAADLDLAMQILVNAKTQRPGVCNAAESLIVHSDVAPVFVPRLAEHMPQVELLGDARSCALLPGMTAATEEAFAQEFLDLRLSVCVVDSADEAIARIRRYGTGHTEAIVSTDIRTTSRFVKEVDAAAVVVNASTRFVDGEALGLGAELGISTQKLHARGPLGLRELTTLKYVIEGEGQIRG